ncbi:MAG: protein kinase [Acidimicrobiales bacterium]|nr:protein kinase [Acidimicrobiales bacterium]MCB9395297.1 protein kinase [Acidimicrobiaceae bacterium]
MRCTQPGCTGSIVDGYCDVCGMAAEAPAVAAAAPNASAAPSTNPSSTRSSSVTNRLGQVPLGSARTAGGSRPTRRLGSAGSASRLGAGFVHVPPVPILDPRQALMDPAVVAEEKRFCSVCQSPVGRARDGSPGRTKGFCPKCRTPFDFDPKLSPGTLLGGQYEIVGCLAHGGMGWIYLARDRNVNDRWVVVKGLLNAGDPDAFRAAVAEKQFLAEVEHPVIVEIYNFVAAADGASYIIMEYVGGQSLNNLLKSRMKDAGGRFSPIPVDQALAFMIEVLPAFSYLHGLGLLYCDFKPANVIQVGDGIKLIDLGGVRRIDDDVTPIYGTVGFQAPEVPADGTSIASDIYTVARTLAVLIFEFKGYQNQYVDRLPSPDEVPLFVEHDSLYRLLLRATAPRPEDRFHSAEELRQQMLGVLREVSATTAGAVSRSTPSTVFTTPTVAGDRLEWDDLPRLVPDATDPNAVWLQSITTDDPVQRRALLASPPEPSPMVSIEQAYAALATGNGEAAWAAADAVLAADPWDWRGVWLQGLVALSRGDASHAVGAFNTVYGTLPGELAPKLALARACELSGDHDVADRLYQVCARTDAAYVAPALFGRARVATLDGRTTDALAALDGIPSTSRAFGESRRKRATILASVPDDRRTMQTLDAAASELAQATIEPQERAALRIDILAAALQEVLAHGAVPGASIGGVAADERSLRTGLEHAYREAASLAAERGRRVALVDEANRVRVRTLT